MNAAIMQLKRRGWDIHAVFAARAAGAGRDHEPPQPQRSLQTRPAPEGGPAPSDSVPGSETEVIGPRLASARAGGNGLLRDPRL